LYIVNISSEYRSTKKAVPEKDREESEEESEEDKKKKSTKTKYVSIIF